MAETLYRLKKFPDIKLAYVQRKSFLLILDHERVVKY